MILSKELIDSIHTLCEVQLDNYVDHAEYSELLDLVHNVPRRLAIEIKRIVLVADSNDLIINLLVNHILDLYDAEEDTCEAENTFWAYLQDRYNFDPESEPFYSYALKATFEEAANYALNLIKVTS